MLTEGWNWPDFIVSVQFYIIFCKVYSWRFYHLVFRTFYDYKLREWWPFYILSISVCLAVEYSCHVVSSASIWDSRTNSCTARLAGGLERTVTSVAAASRAVCHQVTFNVRTDALSNASDTGEGLLPNARFWCVILPSAGPAEPRFQNDLDWRRRPALRHDSYGRLDGPSPLPVTHGGWVQNKRLSHYSPADPMSLLTLIHC